MDVSCFEYSEPFLKSFIAFNILRSNPMKYFYEGLSWGVLAPVFAQKNQDSEGIKCENQALLISMATFANLSAASACFFASLVISSTFRL